MKRNEEKLELKEKCCCVGVEEKDLNGNTIKEDKTFADFMPSGINFRF